MGNEGAGADSDDSDGQGSVSSVERKRHRKKGAKKKKKKGRDDDAGKVDNNKWNYNKHLVPEISPPRSRKVAMERYPTPMPSQNSMKLSPSAKMAITQKLDFESAFDELSKDLEALAGSPSSLSPIDSPSPKSPISSVEASPIHKPAVTSGFLKPARPAPTPPSSGSKRGKPKLQPHLQNKQTVKSAKANTNAQPTQTVAKPARISPISKIASGRNKGHQNKAMARSEKEAQQFVNMAKKSPADFMSKLTNAISSSPKQPRIARQMARSDNSSPPASNSPTMDEIELQLNEMASVLTNAVNDISRRPPSPEFARQKSDTDDLSESDTESSEYTSSSESSTSDTESSSDDSSGEDNELKRPLTPRRPIMARNIGMAAGLKGRGMKINRYRLLARFPKLLRKRMVHLETIHEVPEEKIFSAVRSGLLL